MIASDVTLPITLVMPLYKPRGDWEKQFLSNVEKLHSFLPDRVAVDNIVVYDDLLTPTMADTFARISCAMNNIRFITYGKNKGKGYALRQGVKAVQTPYTLITDFDFPYQKENMAALIEQLSLGDDVVIGKRSASYFRQLPLKRKIISKVCIALKRLFLDLPFYDTQSGIKAFNRAGREVFLTTTIDRFMADTEFVLRSQRHQLSIKEMNIELESYVQFSNFGYSVLKTELLNFVQLVKLNRSLRRTRPVLSSTLSS